MLASLNHANIAAIYGIEEAEGTKALVLELVEGPTLADRISSGPVPMDEALPIARQIAEALEAAHEAGVIHRDLKPANIKVRNDGTVKVLDFGLAKALDAVAPGAANASPTITAMATQMGVIIGTAAYMSPEQARGSAVDRRADIWAFGAVLYEVLVGRTLFAEPSVSDTLASVLRSDIDWTALPSSAPTSVTRLLRRCLDRDPRSRLRDIGEARVALEEAAAGPVPVDDPPLAVGAPGRGWRQAVPWLGGAVAGSILTASALTNPGPAPPAAVSRFAMQLPTDVTFSAGPGSSLALSPDGRTLVYVGQPEQAGAGQLYRQDFDALEPMPVPGSLGARAPFFSPDGEWIAFVAENLLKRVSTRGGPPLTIAEAPGIASGGSWHPDGDIVFTVRNGGLMRVGAEGGTPEPITTVEDDAGVQDHLWPHVTPDGRAVLYTVWSGSLDTAQVAVKPLAGGPGSTLLRGSGPRYLPTGHLVFQRDGALWAAPFDLDTLTVTGSAVAVVPDVVTMTGGGAVQFAISDTGTLTYVRGGIVSTAASLNWIDRKGAVEPLPMEAGEFSGPRLSPDGRQVAFNDQRWGDDANADIWLTDVARGGLRRLTTDPAPDRDPLSAPDGTQVIFSSLRGGCGSHRKVKSLSPPVFLASGGPGRRWSGTGNPAVPRAWRPPRGAGRYTWPTHPTSLVSSRSTWRPFRIVSVASRQPSQGPWLLLVAM